MKAEQIERLERMVERVGNTVFVPIHEWTALLQLARAVSDAPKVKLDWGSFNRGLYVGETWEEAQVNEAALEGQTVALVPVPVKEGKDEG